MGKILNMSKIKTLKQHTKKENMNYFKHVLHELCE